VKKAFCGFFQALSSGTSYTLQNEPSCTALPIEWTPNAGYDISNLGRADFSIHNQEDPTDLIVVDLTIRTPSTENIPEAVNTGGVAADKGFKAKVSQYQSRYILPQHQFIPFAMETTGRIHPSSLIWLKKMIFKMCPRDGNYSPQFKIKELLEKVSIALQRSCACATSLCSELAVDFPSPLPIM
jgi:hypothetical protein